MAFVGMTVLAWARGMYLSLFIFWSVGCRLQVWRYDIPDSGMGYATELTGNVPHECYTMGQMIHRGRDALIQGIFEYDASDPRQTV